MIRAPQLDLSLGMYYYVLSDLYVGDLVAYVKSPRTFRVLEISLDGIKASLGVCGQQLHKANGKYVHMVMCKEGIDTLHAILILRKVFVSPIGYAGLKDADSYSCQFISVRADEPGLRVHYDLGKMKLCVFRYADYPIRRGYLLANHFNVYLGFKRAESYDKLYYVLEQLPTRYIPNYYGYQRFGTIRPVTHLVGKAIVTRSWDDAVRLIAGSALSSDTGITAIARREFDAGNYSEALRHFPEDYVIERIVARAMMVYGDSLRALRCLGKELLRLYIEAYQSYLFNKLLSELLAYFNGVDKLRMAYETLPVPGYRLKLRDDVCSHVLRSLIKDEGIHLEWFLVKELGVYGRCYAREALFRVSDLSYSVAGNGIWLSFTLPSGSYASTLLRELLRAPA